MHADLSLLFRLPFARFILYYLLMAVGGTAAPASSAATSGFAIDKPRLFVLTDISNEPDDEQSLVRLLVYSNEFQIEGLVATTSVWLRDRVRPELIRRQIGAYGEVRENLLKHAPGFPPAEVLLAVVSEGRPEFGLLGVGPGKSSPGSRALIAAVDRPDPRPLWISVWGGVNCLAQALWDVQDTRTTAELEAFVAKLRVYTISDQDDSGAWIRRTFPGVFYIVSPSTVDGVEYYTATWTGISGDRHFRNGPGVFFDLVDNPWLTEHVRQGHGPLGALYPMTAYIMEGDTPSYLNLIGNGLGSDTSPDWGGWGGRYVLRQSYGETRPIWTNSRDSVRLPDGREETSAQATIWRWREAFQHDFAARMDWCVMEPAHANHNPRVVLNGVPGREPVHLDASPGDIIRLSARGSTDPDGHALSFRWFHYPEAGRLRGARPPIPIADSGALEASFIVPEVRSPETLHIILEVVDDGLPALFAYRRILVHVR
jgi:hypothetical protein